MACRLEGDKFAIILPDTSIDGAMIAAEKLFTNLKNIVIRNNSEEYHTTISISVLEYNVQMEVNEFIEVAERKLIKVQSEGGNRVIS